MKSFMIILFAIVTAVWLLWLLGFPFYKKYLKKESLWSSCYSSVLCCMTLIMNLINLYLYFCILLNSNIFSLPGEF